MEKFENNETSSGFSLEKAKEILESDKKLLQEFENAKVFFSHTKDQFKVNSETGKLISEGHEYSDFPKMRSLYIRANNIRESLPKIQEGFTRLWRGNREGEIGKNPSFTNSLEGIALPFLRFYGGELSYIDVPNDSLKEYLCVGGSAPDSEFIVPENLAAQAVAVQEFSDESTKQQAAQLFKKYLDQGGEVDVRKAQKWLATAVLDEEIE